MSTADGAGSCVGCSCCFGLLIDITGSDVHRLARGLALDPRSFVTQCPSDETDDDIGFSLEPGGETFTLVLRQRSAAHSRELIVEHGRPCTFLLGPIQGTTRCGVYGLRPRACRSYPAEILHGEVSLRGIARCPVSTALTGAGWRPDVREEQIEGDLHRVVVWRWNRHVLMAPDRCRFDDYLGYLVDVHDRLAPIWASLTTRPDWPALRESWGISLDDGNSAFLSAPGALPALGEITGELRNCVATIESAFPDEPTWATGLPNGEPRR